MGERENGKVSHQNLVLSGPNKEGTYNRFSCFTVHSKMAQSTNTKSKPLKGLYTDTDCRCNYKGAREGWYHDDGG